MAEPLPEGGAPVGMLAGQHGFEMVAEARPFHIARVFLTCACAKQDIQKKWSITGQLVFCTHQHLKNKKHLRFTVSGSIACVFLQQIGVQEVEDAWLRHVPDDSSTNKTLRRTA